MNDEKLTHQMYMDLLKEELTINTDDVLEYPPTALSYGEKTIKTTKGQMTFPISLGTYGNFSFIQGPPKKRKSFLVSLLASVYLSGQNNFGGNLKGHRDSRCLLHFDTEQGHWHCQRLFKRVLDMANIKDVGCYKTFALRTINYKTRIEFIEHTLKENKGKNGLVIIDGVADLVSSVNELEESNLCVQKIMEWSTLYDCHILTVIHSNFSTDRPTGHLGSFLEKKCETSIQIEQNSVHSNKSTVKCKTTRGYAFDTFSFSVNEFGLPYIVGHIYDPLKDFK